VVIKNSDQHSKDYSILKDKMRPGHADYAGFVRYQGFNDYRGGGHFSGRLTAPLVFIGAVAKQALAQEGMLVGAHILQIADIKEENFNPLGIDDKMVAELNAKDFAVLDDAIGEKMQAKILEAKADLNSVGGVIETMVTHVPAGLGAPYFDSVESRLSHALFSVPAVKGVEFGDGFGISAMTGAEANDALHYEEGKVVADTNHNGGITGGITNGMPVVFRVALKPTPSIYKAQGTVNFRDKKEVNFQIEGRHDPCIVPRALPCVEAAAAVALYDLLLQK
jgi:chorismate synthase